MDRVPFDKMRKYGDKPSFKVTLRDVIPLGGGVFEVPVIDRSTGGANPPMEIQIEW